MEVTYRMQEGFRLPNLLMPQEQETHLGKYAELRRQYLMQHRRGVRPLGVDQDLLVERAFIVIAGRAQKARPALIIAGQLRQRCAVQLRDKLKFTCQSIAS